MSQPLFSVINHDVDYMIRNTHQTRIIMNTKLSYVILIKRVSKGVILIYHFIFSDQEKNDALNIDLYFNIYSFVMKVLKDFFFVNLVKKFFIRPYFVNKYASMLSLLLITFLVHAQISQKVNSV